MWLALLLLLANHLPLSPMSVNVPEYTTVKSLLVEYEVSISLFSVVEWLQPPQPTTIDVLIVIVSSSVTSLINDCTEDNVVEFA